MKTDFKKVTQALNWLAKKEGGKINKMKAIKLVWMADRLHLRKYGRPITKDDYIAMKFGPVGSITRNITDEAVPYLSDEQLGYSKKFIEKISDNFFESINDVDTDVFSESDIESLEQVYNDFGHYNQFELADLTHEFPEWKKFKPELESGAINQAPMSYNDFFDDPADVSPILKEKFGIETDVFNQDADTINASKHAFTESQEIENLWS